VFIGNEAPKFVQLDMLVVLNIHQVTSQLGGISSL
jgi:hypothetical protein